MAKAPKSLVTVDTCFSPLHEGDASVAVAFDIAGRVVVPCFSPLHEGDASVASAGPGCHHHGRQFQSPSRGGRLCGDAAVPASVTVPGFQSPSRGGRLCGTGSLAVQVQSLGFQSPSRGGRLCGSPRLGLRGTRNSGFSPLHEGDASVAWRPESGAASAAFCFSPLHEGDASVAMAFLVGTA